MVYLHLSTLLVVITYVSSNVVPTKSPGTFELLILHNNDMHARFEQTSQLSGTCTMADRDAGKCYGGFPRVAYVVKQAREAAKNGSGPPVLYLNAGDTYTGTPWFTIYKWKIAAEFVNALNPDAVCLGNHEFDLKVDGLVPFIRNISAPVLAANLILDKVPTLREEKNLMKSVILKVNNVSIGIIGYLTPLTKSLAPSNDVEYEDEVVALNREVTKIQTQGVGIIIALGHSGYETDLRIAKEVNGIDLVIGGHSNTFLYNANKINEKPEQIEGPYPVDVVQNSGKLVPVVQAYAYTKYLGKLLITFDADGEITNIDGQPILLDQRVPKDPEVYEIVKKYHKEMEPFNEIVGESLVSLNGQCRLRQCNLGNLITDALLNYTKEYSNNCVNIVLEQGGRIRSWIDRSEKPFVMTRADWLTVLPFDDPSVLVTMNGSLLLKALEHSVDTWRTVDSTGQFLQFSGIHVVYDLSRPVGSRVVKVKAVRTIDSSDCLESDLEDVAENYMYRVLMPKFLADGGDEFSIFIDLPKETVDYKELEAVFNYTRTYGPVKPMLDDRLTVLNEISESKEDKPLLEPKEDKPLTERRKNKSLSGSAVSGYNVLLSYIIMLSSGAIVLLFN